jgi:hypothetical protein
MVLKQFKSHTNGIEMVHIILMVLKYFGTQTKGTETYLHWAELFLKKEAIFFPLVSKFPSILWSQKIYYGNEKISPLSCVLSQTSSDHISIHHFLKFHFVLTVPSYTLEPPTLSLPSKY